MNDKPVAPEDVAVKTSTALVRVREAYDQPVEPHPFTPELHRKMQTAVDHFKVLIGVRSDAHLTFAPKANSAGYFAANRYVGRDGAAIASHQINLNPDHFVGESDEQVASTLAHELVHLWRHENGPPSRGGYHDKIWARKMESIGLMPSSTGFPGGKTTGNKMSHFILRDGPFAQSFTELQATGWRLDLESAPRAGSAKGPPSKVKYSCSRCSLNIWAKPGVEVLCKRCSIEYGSMIDMIAEGAPSDLARAAE